MRAAPAVSILADVPPAARMAVGLLGLLATFATLAWAGSGGGGLRFGVPLASLALTLHLLVELHAAPTRRLRWDGSAWWLKPDRPGAEEVRGEVSVAGDLGDGLLLHFVAAGGPWRGRSAWLPLRRREVVGDWHALRCALYSPRKRVALAASGAIDG